ncbi:hypothetical protein BKH46_03550 [Helicobacter sp. 12S02634-8]|uniref:outer membrane beta-barrel protein n=1 Tax=Helicobacter sp. 12S02634-8 TaxID=1476199 RepID=UPI000BA68456|nr:outer membrane beta-barrel protein [Helicobacter sp. 12S02634-8]PAF47515.1 hypothetical protein BKH46_03550 [Helicobacter sp. 12S02634-8]
MRFLILGVMILPLFAVQNTLFTSFGGGLGARYQTDFWQQTTKDNSSCAGGTCIGNKTSGSYSGGKGHSFTLSIGDEVSFDPYSIIGVRVYGSVQYANASLGSLIAGSVQEQSARDKEFTTITSYNPNTPDVPPTIGKVPMKPVPKPQDFLFSNGIWMSYGVGLDFFLNLPIDVMIRKLFWEKMPDFKVGVFAGGGVEYAMLRSNSWHNQSSGEYEKFFASGSGVFAKLGSSVYFGRHNRINVDIKIPYYKLNAQSWHDYGDTDVWKQQLLRQNFDIYRNKEISISYTYLF